MINNKFSTKKLVLSALFAALTFVATYISFPISLGGYVNLGDCFVILSGLILGPFGIASSIVGSCLCDLVIGYAIYIPATAIIKGVMALIVYYFTKTKHSLPRRLLSSFLAEIVMVSGYLTYEWAFLIGSAAITSVPYNCIQGAVGIISSMVIYTVLEKTGVIKKIIL
ncbi:MAG: ECF transporter S component [Acutalibacteraceae bacterium]|nr:ECF transporter S component [Acutalibacteraceae bacterium]